MDGLFKRLEHSSDVEEAAVKKEYDLSRFMPAVQTVNFGFGEYTKDWADEMKNTDYLSAARGWVYACMDAIGKDCAAVEMCLRTMKTDGEIEEIDEHPALELMYRPNNAMTRFDLIYLTFAYLELTGEAPWYVSFVNGKPNGIILLRPDKLKIIPGANGELIGGYKYSVAGKDGGATELTLQPFEVIPLHYPNPDNILRGLSPLQAAARAYNIDDYASRFNSRFFKNAAVPNAVLTVDRKLTKEEKERLDKKVEEKYSSYDNAHKTLVLEGGLEWKPMQVSQREMDFIESRKFSRDEILAIFRVPKSILGIVEDVNRANGEASDIVFAKRNIKPKMMMITEQLTEFFLPLFVGTEQMYVDFEDPVPSNRELLLKEADTGIRAGYLTINEARELEGYDPLPEGDVLQQPQAPAADPNAPPAKGIKVKRMVKKLTISKIQKMGVKARSGKILKRRKFLKMVKEVVSKQLADVVFEELKKKKASREFPVKSIVGVKEAGDQKEIKLKFQKAQIGIAAKYEAAYIYRMSKVFEAQKHDIAKQLKAGIKNPKLDIEKNAKLTQDNVEPVIRFVIREQSRRAFRLVGQDDVLTSDKVVSPAMTKYLKVRIFKLAQELTKETNSRLGDAIALGVKKEESIPQIANRVRSLFNDMEVSRSKTIARTEVMRATSFATEESYKKSGVVKGMEWLAYLDGATDEDCADLDGKVAPLGGNFGGAGLPPLHPNCRCTLIPVLDKN